MPFNSHGPRKFSLRSYLNRWLHAFEYRVYRIANENCSNDTASFVERENALLGDDTEHLEYLDVIHLYLHAKVLVSYVYNNANDFPVLYVRPSTILIFRIWIRWNSFFKSSSDCPKVAKLSSQTLRVLR